MKLDFEIVCEVYFDFIEKVVVWVGIDEKYLEFYGCGVVKVDFDVVIYNRDYFCGKYVVVMVMIFMFFGEGKMIIVVGLV